MIYLEKFKIVKAAETAAMEYVQVMIVAMKMICGTLIGLPAFTTTFCILELYHLLVSCLFGNEKLSKVSLTKRRGFGLNEELFCLDMNLSALGLKFAYPYYRKFCTYFAGEKKQQSLALIFSCLYYVELQNLPHEIASTDLVSKVANCVSENVAYLSEDREVSEEYMPVSMTQFIHMFCRKYRRNLFKCIAGKVVLEAYVSSANLQQVLCEQNVVISISHAGQNCVFKSRNLTSALTSLKQWFKKYSLEDFTNLWYRYTVEKTEVHEKDAIGLSTVDNLLASSCQDAMCRDEFEIHEAFYDPDIVSR